jgi:hypothetical protein
VYARNVSIRLRPGSAVEFTQTLEDEVIPLLRKQKGFQDEVTFVSPGGLEAVAISFWDGEASATSYDHAIYPEVQKALMKVLAGPPQIRGYVVSNSTFHNIAAPEKG